MFTGIIDHAGKIEHLEPMGKGLLFWVHSAFPEVKLGESISVDGACLTVVRVKENQFAVQVSPETLRLTIAGDYQIGTKVNLERALSLGDSLGGHWVTGHVDSTVKLGDMKAHEEFTEIIFEDNTPECRDWIIHKGSVCINGVSLTVNEKRKEGFSVMIIPHTAKITNFSNLKVGSIVNIEYDYLAKIIQQRVQQYQKEVV